MKLHRSLVIFGADIVVALPHAEGMIKQTLAHPPSLPAPPKRTNLGDEPKEANRAETIVRGAGAIILLLLLGLMTQVLPQILKGKDTHEMMSTMIQIIVGFTILCGLVGVLGLVVWVKVRNGKKK